MIPLRIRVRNFLSYGEEPGGLPVTFDFDGAKLWSVAGANGAGKSALFDAITWTLFGEHRGGKSEDHRLVKQGCAQGSAAFEFRFGAETYRVERSVAVKSRATKRQASVLLDLTTDTWRAIPGTDGAGGFDAWVAGLGLRYKTFIASTLLLQGKSDQLIVAKPKDRFDVLSGALDLRAYEAFAMRARDLAAARATVLQVAEARLASTPVVTPADVDAAQGAFTKADKELVAAEARVAEAATALADAQRAEQLRSAIAAARTRIDELAELLAEAESIARDYAEWLELSNAVPVLERLDAELGRAEADEERARELAARAASLDGLGTEARARASAEATTHAMAALTAAREKLAQAQVAQATAVAQRTELDHCEQLERLARAAHDDLEQLAALTAANAGVRDQLAAAEHLRDAEPLARPVINAEAAHAQRVERCRALGDREALDDERRMAIDAQREATAARDAAAVIRDEAQAIVAAATATASNAQERLGSRMAAAGDGRCSRCGQVVDADHIERELRDARADVVAAAEAEWTADDGLVHATNALAGADAAVATSAIRLREIEERLQAAIAAELERTTAAAALADARAQVAAASAPIAAIAEELVGLTPTRRATRLAELARLPDLRVRAERLGADEGRATSLRAQAEGLDHELAPLRALLPDAERRARREASATAVAALQTVTTEIADRDEAQRLALDARDRDEQVRAATVSQRDDLLTQASQNAADARASRARAEGMSTALPLAVRGRLVSDGAAVLEQTRTRVAELRTAPTRHNELATARERYQQAVVERDGLVRDLETIPDEHREPLVSVESRRAQIQRGRDDALAARTAAAAATEVARAGVRAYEGLRDAASGALVAERRARRLADLLGRNRLMARLLAQALRDLQRIANEMLAHTSGGQLELRLSLVAHSGEEHVEIQAIDHGSVERPMEVAFISGGQKFRVAVALAAAIGQYTGASAAGRSLIVDEGFGSLDEEGRAQMIAELQAAAPLMDRIVVVSHHEDFSSRELFPSAFLVEKGPNGTTARRVV